MLSLIISLIYINLIVTYMNYRKHGKFSYGIIEIRSVSLGAS